MNNAISESSQRLFRPFVAASIGVAVWRVLALTVGEPNASTPVLGFLLATLGGSFLAAGLITYQRRHDTPAALFSAFCVCSGLHWGGPITISNESLNTALLLLYILLSSILGSTLLLHFALVYVRARAASNRVFMPLLYVPTVLAAALAGVILFTPSESANSETLQQVFLVGYMAITNLFGAATLVILIVPLFTHAGTAIGKSSLVIMVAGLLIAWLPDIVVSSLGGDSEPWTLTFVAIPIAFAIALLRKIIRVDSANVVVSRSD